MSQTTGSLKSSLLFGVGGLTYGLALATIGMGAANGGDGAMVPLYIYGSPLFLPLLFFAPIIIWPSIALILSRAAEPAFKKAFVLLMMIHYIGAVPYLVIWGDWDHFSQLWNRSSASVFILIAAYVAGQVAIWFLFAATQQIVGRERNQIGCRSQDLDA